MLSEWKDTKQMVFFFSIAAENGNKLRSKHFLKKWFGKITYMFSFEDT